MAKGVPTRHLGKHWMKCRLCGSEFLAKRINTTVCYADQCQKKLEAEKHRQSYLKKCEAQRKKKSAAEQKQDGI